MIKSISLQSLPDTESWDAYVGAHPSGTPFHTTPWIRTLVDTYRFRPYLYAYFGSNGRIMGVLPLLLVRNALLGHRLVSLPYSDYGGPLCTDDSIRRELINVVLAEHNDRILRIELRGILPAELCIPGRFRCENLFERHVLPLQPDPLAVMEILEKRTLRYSIRKAIKHGIIIRESSDPEGLESFYRLNRLTRTKHGVPCQPVAFFQNLYRNMIMGSQAFILNAYDGKSVVAAGMFFRFNKEIHYKYNASDPVYLMETKRTPNHLLTWFAIEQGCLAGSRTLDFGRTEKSNTGLVAYKDMWGAQSYDLPYFHFYPRRLAPSESSTVSSTPMAGMKVWNSLPEPLQRVLEPFVFRHMA